MLVVTTMSAIVLMAVLGLSICFEADASDEDSNNAKERRLFTMQTRALITATSHAPATHAKSPTHLLLIDPPPSPS